MGFNVGVLIKDTDVWRQATRSECETVQEQKGDCVRVIAQGSADVVICMVGPYSEPSMCMLYNATTIVDIRDMLRRAM